jgi:hypothetical protein
MQKTSIVAPTSWDDARDVRIMWLWSALNHQVRKATLSERTRDDIMHDCFSDMPTEEPAHLMEPH